MADRPLEPPCFVSGLPLRLEMLDEDHWKLLDPLVYESDHVGPVTVPAGFVTDLQSIPRWLPLFYSIVKGPGAPASVLHDYGYTYQSRPRAATDWLFWEANLVCGVSPALAWLEWSAVRTFGGLGYQGHPAVHVRYLRYLSARGLSTKQEGLT